jgi:hypothetical protein
MDEDGDRQCTFRRVCRLSAHVAPQQKINAGNSWNFALIDYFHDMSLLRNDDGNSINFQRASCTLDGCVKIWTSRVDSVGTETGKLLSNLANDGKDEDDDGNGSDNPDEEATAKKKKSHRPAATLAKDPAQLRSKKLDLEFSVDPLFKKTCADFDEGGAQGLLMNHLSLGTGSEAGLRVIFDASDSVGKVDENEDMDEPEEAVDLTELRSRRFFTDAATCVYEFQQANSYLISLSWRIWKSHRLSPISLSRPLAPSTTPRSSKTTLATSTTMMTTTTMPDRRTIP